MIWVRRKYHQADPGKVLLVDIDQQTVADPDEGLQSRKAQQFYKIRLSYLAKAIEEEIVKLVALVESAVVEFSQVGQHPVSGVLKIILLLIFMRIPLENLTFEELNLLGGLSVPFMTFKNSWRENPDKLVEGVLFFLLAKETEEASVDAGLVGEILAAGDDLNEVIKQLLC